jgi:opacity protein-like surface antigen
MIMKKYLFALSLFICALVTSQTQAQDCNLCCLDLDKKFYAGAFAGANWFNFDNDALDEGHLKFDVGYHASVFVGYKFAPQFRIEGEIAYRRNNLDHFKHLGQRFKLKSHTYSWSYMANFLYDFHFDCLPVKPYVGIGVGYTRISTSFAHEDISIKDHASGLSWQAIAGFGYPIYADVDLGVEYHYFQGRQHAVDHSVGLSLKHYF